MGERVVVVGAGVSGLACAYDLARAGRDVLVLEAAPRAGGVVGTIEAEGFQFETGPNTIPASAAAFRTLAGELGIADRLIVSSPDAKLRFLFHRGALRPLPAGPGAFLRSPLLSFAGKRRVLSEPLRKRRRLAPDEEEPTFEAFLTERIGREATRTLAGAFVRGVYAAEIEELGARSAFPRLFALANEHGGLVRGMLAKRRASKGEQTAPLPGPAAARTDLLSFPRGLRELVDALTDVLGDRLRTGAAVRALALEGGTGAGCAALLESGERIPADVLVLAVPAPVASRLLGGPNGDVELGALGRISHAEVTLCHLGLTPPPGAALPAGFGFLVPPDEAPPEGTMGRAAPCVLGTLFPSNIFPGRAPAGAVAVSSFYRTADVRGLAEPELAQHAARDLALALDWQAEPEIHVARTQHWSDVIPRYGVGHDRSMARIERRLAVVAPAVRLAGSYTRGVSVEECIARGRAVAGELLGTRREGAR
ncbi:MAG: protoporphyrinogen oxidase [Planctomycetota bacterium]|nr:MAG: protoporphyrinogen oxidase [Planctomycetota bacterium]